MAAAQKRLHLPILYAVLSEELQIQPLLVGVKLLAWLVCHIAVYLLCHAPSLVSSDKVLPTNSA